MSATKGDKYITQKKMDIKISAYFIGMSFNDLGWNDERDLGHKIDLAGVAGDLRLRKHWRGTTRDSILFEIPCEVDSFTHISLVHC